MSYITITTGLFCRVIILSIIGKSSVRADSESIGRRYGESGWYVNNILYTTQSLSLIDELGGIQVTIFEVLC